MQETEWDHPSKGESGEKEGKVWRESGYLQHLFAIKQKLLA